MALIFNNLDACQTFSVTNAFLVRSLLPLTTAILLLTLVNMLQIKYLNPQNISLLKFTLLLTPVWVIANYWILSAYNHGVKLIRTVWLIQIFQWGITLIIATILAYLILGEKPDLKTWVGIVLVISGVLIAQK